jgi:hypothetical protein
MLLVDDFDKGAIRSNFLTRKAGLLFNASLKICQSLLRLL